MKTNKLRNNRISILFSLTALLLFHLTGNAQLRVSTTGGVTVGDTTTTSTGLKVIGGDINLNGASNSFQINGNKILWHDGNTADIFVGYNAGNSTMSGHNNTLVGNTAGNANTTGANNTAIGYNAFKLGTTAYSSIAIGSSALAANTTGAVNMAIGANALLTNTTGLANTASGTNSLYANTTGGYNTANGMYALFDNTTSSYHTAVGYSALSHNTTGANNTATGYSALGWNSTGYNNTAIGYLAGFGSSIINKDTSCTFVGYGADANGNYLNASAFGNGTIVTARNKMFFGNASVTDIRGQVAFGIYSDGRFKNNVTENVKGLEFIKKLRPVTYNINTEALDDFIIQNMTDSIKVIHKQGMDFAPSMAIVHSGFIAQEVELAAQQSGFISSIVSVPANSTDPYALSYAEFVVPLVKAVQELSSITDSLTIDKTNQDSIINAQNAKIDDLQNQILNCCNILPAALTNTITNPDNTGNINGSGINDIPPATTPVLYQNVPNPFNQQTSIQYFVPEKTQSASIMVFDLNGKLISTVPVTSFGKGAISINGNALSPGMFVYSLIVDGKIIDTKRMILTN